MTTVCTQCGRALTKKEQKKANNADNFAHISCPRCRFEIHPGKYGDVDPTVRELGYTMRSWAHMKKKTRMMAIKKYYAR